MERSEEITTQSYTYTVVLEPNELGGYTVTCPALPGVVTQGKDIQEARENAAEAIECYLESLRKDRLPLPAGEEYEEEPLRDKVTVKLSV